MGAACYGPTEFRVEISTDFPCTTQVGTPPALVGPPRTTVKVGGATADESPVADTRACTPRTGGADIGSLVVVPSGDRTARVTLEVTTTADGSDPEICGHRELPMAARAQCIVARRSFAFIEHKSWPLPVVLYAVCKGQLCEATAGETCSFTGACVSGAVDAMGHSAADPPDDGGAPDAANATDASAPDAEADVAVDAARASCTNADGGHELFTGGTLTDQLAANTTGVFWIAGGTLAETVYTYSTAKPGPPDPLFSVGGNLSTTTAIAADDLGVWVATPQKVLRYDFMKGKGQLPQSFSIQDATAIATTLNPASATGGAISTTAFVAGTTTAGDGTTTSGIFAIDSDTATILPVTGLPALATRLAVARGKADLLYAYVPSAATDSHIFGRTITPAGPWQKLVTTVATGMAADNTSVFFAGDLDLGAGSGVHRLDRGAGSGVQRLFSVTNPGLVAVDDNFVFFAQRGPGGGIFRGPKSGVTPTAFQLITPMFKADVNGLATDAQCVYFWGANTSSNTGSASLNIYPKVP